MDENYKVYIKTDGTDIVAVNSSAFLADLTDWIEIDEGLGDRYHHAQGNYFDKPLMTDIGIYRYRYDGEITEKTAAEIEAEEAALPAPAPSLEERISNLDMVLETLIFEVLPGTEV